MYLRSLEMQGFKSFPDKTKLTFERGTTVIVGPNGSGKSNISDAMRWVLGELSSKSLRGTKMEDIIFGGADTRRPMGFAEVSVTFDNTSPENRLDCPYDEVTVTRRYYRAGESEYFINRRPCRLRDVYELFMNTGVGRDGYSIIGQGKIAEIISRKSDERRSIFEDASGIAKYRHRKNETERRLKTTEENMARVNDIFQEVAAQVGPLEKEAERARRALELHEQKKKADVQLWLFDSERLRVDIEAAEENFRNSGYDLRIAEEAIENFNAQSAQLFEESQSNKAKAAEVLERIRALTKENYERDSQYQVAENAIANTREKIETANAVIATREEQLKGEEAESARRRATCDELAARLAELEGAHTRKAEQAQELASRALTIAGDIATALADIDQRESEVMDVRVRMQVIENGKRTDSGKHESMTAEIAEYQAIAERLGAEHARKQASVDGYAAQIAEAEGRLAVIDGALGDKQAELVEVLEAEKECKLQSDLARQRIEAFRAMEEHFEGYGNSVRFVMEAYAAGRITNQNGSKCGKIYGPLSKVISVDKAYVTAIEIALGVNLQHIVVEDESVAKAAIYTLKQAQAGRATFFPISSMRGQTPTVEMDDAAECKGYIGVASDLVNCEDKFREIVASLLGRTVVFDNLDNATEMARRTKFRVKAVTLDGQVINAGGSFSGGSVKQRSGILSRAGEIAALDEKLKALALDAESLGKERAALEKEIAALNADRADIDERRQLLASMQGTEASVLAQLQAKIDANAALIEKLNTDFEALTLQRASYDEELVRLAEYEKQLRHQITEIGALRQEKDLARNALLDEKTVVESEMTELYIGISGVRKDIETATNYLEESLARAEALRAEIAAQRSLCAQLEENVRNELLRQEANRNTHAEGERVLAELNARHASLVEGDMAFERKLADVNAKLRAKMAEKENFFRAHTKNEARLLALREEQDKISTKFWEDYEMTRNDALALG
ncbi:MAG: chromosome segregation protein SMC, partial [Clostridia bacterium]|nr:chromosome segregation protein SMC [Clostridia bacterium]